MIDIVEFELDDQEKLAGLVALAVDRSRSGTACEGVSILIKELDAIGQSDVLDQFADGCVEFYELLESVRLLQSRNGSCDAPAREDSGRLEVSQDLSEGSSCPLHELVEESTVEKGDDVEDKLDLVAPLDYQELTNQQARLYLLENGSLVIALDSKVVPRHLIERNGNGRYLDRSDIEVDAQVEQLSVDTETGMCRSGAGSRTRIPPRTLDQLKIFLSRQGSYICKDEIHELLYGMPIGALDRKIDNHVSRLRKLLFEHGIQDAIMTRRNNGYMLSKDAPICLN